MHRGLSYPFSVFPAQPGSHHAYDLARPSLITTCREGRSTEFGKDLNEMHDDSFIRTIATTTYILDEANDS